jgi:hypothetical protein
MASVAMTLTAVAFQSLMTFASTAGWAATLRSALPEVNGQVFLISAPGSIGPVEARAPNVSRGVCAAASWARAALMARPRGGGGQQLERGTSISLIGHG